MKSALIILNPQDDVSADVLNGINDLLDKHWDYVVYACRPVEPFHKGLHECHVTVAEAAKYEADTIAYNDEISACYGMSYSITTEAMARTAKIIYVYLQLMGRQGRCSAFDRKTSGFSLEEALKARNVTSVKICGFTDMQETVSDAVVAGFTVL